MSLNHLIYNIDKIFEEKQNIPIDVSNQNENEEATVKQIIFTKKYRIGSYIDFEIAARDQLEFSKNMLK